MLEEGYGLWRSRNFFKFLLLFLSYAQGSVFNVLFSVTFHTHLKRTVWIILVPRV
jgi:hypothetical protein